MQPILVPTQHILLPTQPLLVPKQYILLPTQHILLPTQHTLLPTQPILVPKQHILLPTQHILLPTQPILVPNQHILLPTQHIVLPTQHTTMLSTQNVMTQLSCNNALFLPYSLNFCVGVCISFTTLLLLSNYFAYLVSQIILLFKASQKFVDGMRCGREAVLQDNFFRL